LEHDTSNHDVSAGCCVAVDLGGLSGCHSAADCLHDERDDVAGDEDPEVEVRWEDGRLTAETSDKFSKENINACCEEGGSYDRISTTIFINFRGLRRGHRH